MLEKLKNLCKKGYEEAAKAKINMDQQGGPGLEEAALLLFIALPILTNADSAGGIVGRVFTKVTTAIENALKIS